MPYIFAIIAAVSFASGFGVSYQISKAEIQHMSDGIAAQNKEAELTLATLTLTANRAHESALNANKQMEDANVSAINAINSQHDAFKSQRMYDTHRARHSCAPTSIVNTTSTTQPVTDNGELSIQLTEFLKSEAYRADEISNYATLCNQFIKGIPR
jgi:hypothetical protein